MSIVINNKFELGQIVYIVTDEDQRKRIVTCIRVCPSNMLYEISYGTGVSTHYDFELSTEKNPEFIIDN